MNGSVDNADNISIPSDDAKLLAECTVHTYRANGKGGQHVNKTDSAVRIRHSVSGITVTSQRERSQYLNKKHCLKKIRTRIEKLQDKPTPRIPTKLSAGKKRVRKVTKIHQAAKKRFRRAPDLSDE